MPGSAGATTSVLSSRRAEPPRPLGFYEHRYLGSGATICFLKRSGREAITFLCQRVASGGVFVGIGDHHGVDAQVLKVGFLQDDLGPGRES